MVAAEQDPATSVSLPVRLCRKEKSLPANIAQPSAFGSLTMLRRHETNGAVGQKKRKGKKKKEKKEAYWKSTAPDTPPSTLGLLIGQARCKSDLEPPA